MVIINKMSNMKRVSIFSILAAVALCGCQVAEISEDIPAPAQEAVVFTAIIEDDAAPGTKTYLDGDGNILWKQGDRVSIFGGSTLNQQFQVSDESAGHTAATLNPVSSSGFIAGTELEHNIAFYPYISTAEVFKKGESSYEICSFALPARQYYAENSFGNGAFPMAAVTTSTDDKNLKFKNLLGGIKLQVKGTAKIASVSITGGNDDYLCGDVSVTVSNESTPVIELDEVHAGCTVTLDCGEGVQLNTATATSFIIALPPMTFSRGFTITINDTDNKRMVIKSTREQIINRSKLLKMPEVTFATTDAVDLGLTSGILWATCNLSEYGFVDAPEEYGDYYAWGENGVYYQRAGSHITWRAGAAGYAWSTYRWSGNAVNTLTKYNTNTAYGTVVDNLTTLEAKDDIAHIILGGSWRMPTNTEVEELRTKCTWTWKTQNGVNGYLVEGPNGNSIFLPAAGMIYGTELGGTGTHGVYWSSSLSTYEPIAAWDLYFTSEGVSNGDYRARYCGYSIRPVTE